MADRSVKSTSSITKKRIKKIRVKQPDPTTEEIDTFGSDINIKLMTPSISIDRDYDTQTIHIEDFK
ncbi:SWPV1-129 [Shearwaterpox virus]|uniref:SWPV1-129 n=1 Tax=Shearwaterpox virus TaxID=1974596 RepID=A0A1V0QGV5_CNPV|nr:SWPV1-129 [Shearwaterpox virus]